MDILPKSLLIWVLMIPLGIINGILRVTLISPLIGMKYALPLSGIILLVLIFIVTYLLIPYLGRGTKNQYLIIGLIWVIFTITFETLYSLFIEGNPYSQVINAYNILTGNLWLLDIVFIGTAPFLVAKMQNLI